MIPRPIFIIGSGRSGTSSLTWCIGQHPNIIATPETSWLSSLASHIDTMHRVGAGVGHLQRFDVDRHAFFRLFGNSVDQLVRDTYETKFPDRRSATKPSRQNANGVAWYRSPDDPKTRWADGTPSSTPYVYVLAEMFPEAKFINLVRRPDDVVLSWLGFRSRAKEHAWAWRLVRHVYQLQRIGYLAEAAVGPDRVMRVLFEDLIENPEPSLRGICAFIGEEYTPHMIEPLLAGKINSSGARKAEFERESRSILAYPWLRSMRQWNAAAQDASWRIASKDDATRELLAFAKRRMPG
jgi:hypothetical protein